MKMKRAGLFAAVLCVVSLIAAAPVSAKNTFTDGGAIVWGFVPLRDLTLMEAEDGGVYSGASSES